MYHIMKIGVISDTHGHADPTRETLRLLDSFGVDLIIHCGDVGAELVPLFAGRPVHLVAGNTDDMESLRRAVQGDDGREVVLRQSATRSGADPAKTLPSPFSPSPVLYNPLGMLEIEGIRIAFMHGDDARLLRETIGSDQWDMVCHGHTHVYSHYRQGRTLVLNPGALWRTRDPSLALVELPSLEVTKINL
jgi:uncharacterized protein